MIALRTFQFFKLNKFMALIRPRLRNITVKGGGGGGGGGVGYRLRLIMEGERVKNAKKMIT